MAPGGLSFTEYKMIEAMSLAAAVLEKMIMNILC